MSPTDNEEPPRTARQLPIVTIDGKPYFRDDRLGEFRAIDNPHEVVPFSGVFEVID